MTTVPVPATAKPSAGRILVVDDSQLVLIVAKQRLEAAGYAVTLLKSPVLLPSVIADEHPDLVLIDVNMPLLSGPKVLETLKNRPLLRGISFVYHSDRPEEELAELVRTTSADGFLRKTGNGEAFVGEVARWVERARTGKRNRVVVLDDDSAVAHSIAGLLSSRGYVVTVCTEASAAETLLDFEPPDVLVSDLCTAGHFAVQGLDLLRSIRRRNLRTAVVLITGLSVPHLAEEAASLGALGLLQKPFPSEALFSLLERHLGRTEPEGEGAVMEIPTIGELVGGNTVTPRFLPTYRRRDSKWVLDGFEGLVVGPAGTSLANPLALFAFAEKGEKLAELDLFCVRRIVEAMGKSGSTLELAFNLHPATLRRRGVATEILEILRKARRDPKKTVAEIVERGEVSLSMELSDNLAVLRKAGVRIALDDVGEGNANLVGVAAVAPDVLKISQTFTRDVAKNPMKLQIIRTLFDLAERLRIETVIEGVESPEDYAVVRDLGARTVQGYFFSPPRTVDHFGEIPREVAV